MSRNTGLTQAALLGALIVFCCVPHVRAQNGPAPAFGGMNDSPHGDSSTAAFDRRASGERPAWHAMVTNVPGDLATLPAQIITPSGITTVAGLGVLTAALIMSDADSYRKTRVAVDGNPFAQNMCDFMEHAGDGRIHLGIAAAFGIAGLAVDDSRALRTGSQIVEALLATGITVQVLKHMTGRESPQVAIHGAGEWHWFPSMREYDHHQARYYAFPSGHIATTMSTVTVLAENYPEVWWIRPVGYSIVGLVGVSIVGVRYHWYSDLPLGIALGYTYGTIVSRHNNESSRHAGEPSAHQVSVVPTFSPAGPGVTVSMSL